MLPASSFKLFDPLINLCIKAEKALGTEVRKGFLVFFGFSCYGQVSILFLALLVFYF